MVKKKKKVTTKKQVAIKRKDPEEGFREICYDYSTRHPGDMTLVLLLEDPMVSRAVVAWPNVRRSIQMEGETKESPWDHIWFDREGWMESARVPKIHGDSVMKTVIDNNLVFADGTMPDASRVYLLARARSVMGLPVTGGN